MLTPQDIRNAVFPLRLIFWGGLLCIFDFTFSQTVNGEGFKFDILNDAVGAGMIAVGVFKLAVFPVHERYALVMGFVRVIAVIEVILAIQEHFIIDLPSFIDFGLMLLSIVSLAAVVAFCVAMQWFCEEALLREAARSWRTTTILFVAIYLVPLGLFYFAACLAFLTGSSFNINLGPAGLLLLAIFVIPLVHLFISTSRMARAAEHPPTPIETGLP